MQKTKTIDLNIELSPLIDIKSNLLSQNFIKKNQNSMKKHRKRKKFAMF